MTAAEVADVGDEIVVLVSAVTPERFYASIKQAHPELNPWRDPGRFCEGSVHRGEVTGVVDWGAAIKIAPGITGMVVDQAAAAWAAIGATVEVEVVLCERGSRKLQFIRRVA